MHAAELESLRRMTHHIWDLEQVPQALPFAVFAVNCCVVTVGMQHRPTWPACVDHHQPNISVALHLQHRTSLFVDERKYKIKRQAGSLRSQPGLTQSSDWSDSELGRA